MALNAQTSSLTLFGATGDLARRMLFPSLHFLDANGLLRSDFRIVGADRSNLTDDAFRGEVMEWIRADRAQWTYLT